MSIKTNSIANYVGKAYVIVIGIVVLPLYMQYLGDEAYGLVGLFTVVQAWTQLLNIGLSPALGREAAKARASVEGFECFFRVLVSYEKIFLLFSSVLVLFAFLANHWMANAWLNVKEMVLADVELALTLMLISSAIRFQGSLYRSGIMGLEHQVFINAADILFSSLRFLGGLFLVAAVSDDVVHYFYYQLVVSLFELLVIRAKQFSLVPGDKKNAHRFYWGDVKPTLPFAMGVAYTAGLWTIITQIDKAILSSVLPLDEFGYYTLVALIAGGILQISHPLSEAIRPRMTRLAESGKTEALHYLYLVGTQIVTAVCFSAAFIIAFNAQLLIFLWTGNERASLWSEEVLLWFVLGNGILVVAAFQYYLQFAYGKLKLHVFGASLSGIVQIPILAYASVNYGALGAAKAWFVVRLFFFLFWVPIVHRKFVRGLHMKWLLRGVVPALVTAFFASALVSLPDFQDSSGRLYQIGFLVLQSAFVLGCSALCIDPVRLSLKERFF